MRGKTQEGRALEGISRDRKVRVWAQEVVGAGGATCGDLQCQRQRQRHVAAPLLLRAATVVAVAATRDDEIQNQMAREKRKGCLSPLCSGILMMGPGGIRNAAQIPPLYWPRAPRMGTGLEPDLKS